MTSFDVITALRKRFGGNEFAFLCEVASSTGAGATRSADALAMGLWPSRGIDLHGFEVKISRGDWLRELKNPGKADPIARFCDFWWLATPDSVIKDDELPETWGHIIVGDDGKSKVVKQAPRFDAQPLNKSFVAAIMRRMVEQATPEAERNRITNEARLKGIEEGKKVVEGQRDYRAEQTKRTEAAFRELQQKVRAFEIASGISLNGYEGPEALGEMVRQVRENERVMASVRKRLTDGKSALLDGAEALGKALATIAPQEVA